MDEHRSGDELSWEGVLDAGRVLFGARAEAVLGGGGWRKELKRAYRRRVLETHPDRARSLGRAEGDLAREFRAVVAAYHVLLAAPERAPASRGRTRQAAPRASPPRRSAAPPRPAPPRREPAPPPRREPAPPRRQEPAPAARRRDGPVDGERREDARTRKAGARAPRVAILLPARRLRLAEFLFYSGRIPFEALVEAIAWQRRQRPPVGRIAVECGFLTPAQVIEVMSRRLESGDLWVPFAEYATRIGLLTPFARLAVLGRQRKGQRRIGRFFVERGWVSEAELEATRQEMLLHNVRFGNHSVP